MGFQGVKAAFLCVVALQLLLAATAQNPMFFPPRSRAPKTMPPPPPTSMPPPPPSQLAPFILDPPPFTTSPASPRSMATRFVWAGSTCSGSVAQSYTIGIGPSNTCNRDLYGGSTMSVCTNGTGLVEYHYGNPNCKGQFSEIRVRSVRTCLLDGALYTDFCGSEFTNRIEPSTPGRAIPGAGTVYRGATKSCPNGVCPAGVPYATNYVTGDCTGSTDSRPFINNLELNKCLLLVSENLYNNIKATCSKGTLQIDEFNVGCESTPIRSTVYPTGTCVRQSSGLSTRYFCGNENGTPPV